MPFLVACHCTIFTVNFFVLLCTWQIIFFFSLYVQKYFLALLRGGGRLPPWIRHTGFLNNLKRILHIL